MEKENPYRLPRNIKPVYYNICLRIDPDADIFYGTENIKLQIVEPTSSIIWHGVFDLEDIKYVYLANCGEPKWIINHKEMQAIEFRFDHMLIPQEATFKIHYTGKITDDLSGVYRIKYELNGKQRNGIATQFEATDARKCFFCIDEPDAKAPIELSIIAPKDRTVLSNMPMAEDEFIISENKLVKFQPTPIMSTYLLAFVVCDLEHIEAVDKNGTLIRVWTLPEKKEQGRFALECALHALSYFTELFSMPYPLPKLDLVGLPDFGSMAMENWGLITFREAALLIDEAQFSFRAKRLIAEVVDHEIAHQWFGNLVTMTWWTHLWLNEGFATYMSMKAMADKFPDWNIWAYGHMGLPLGFCERYMKME